MGVWLIAKGFILLHSFRRLQERSTKHNHMYHFRRQEIRDSQLPKREGWNLEVRRRPR